jgi:hypothetical protein
MSYIHFRTVPILSPVEAIARYEQADYTLIVGPRGEIPVAMHRLSIDTLTLSFSPDQHVLKGVDDYTNSQQWERLLLAPPPVDQEMALICIEHFDEHGIGQAGSGPVQYLYSEETSLLLIRIGDGHVVTRIRCLSCGICGLGTHGELFEIWVQGVVL